MRCASFRVSSRDKTTGTPIMLMIENVDQRSKDYSEVAKAYRPGHADYAYDAKYGLRDYRGGGRSSARETAARVAAGGVARLVIPGSDASSPMLSKSVAMRLTRPISTPRRSPTTPSSAPMPRRRRAGRRSSTTRGLPAPRSARWSNASPLVFPPAGARRSMASSMPTWPPMMGINAVKGVEIGDGFAAARLTGEQNADRMRPGV